MKVGNELIKQLLRNMVYNEQQLEGFSQKSFKYEVEKIKDTHQPIREAINMYFDSQAVAEQFGFTPELDVYLQGSYRNNTNVTKTSDVDLVVLLKSIWRANKESLNPDQLAKYDASYISVQYPFEQFNLAIQKAVQQYFGVENVSNENKCLKVKEHGKYINADIVPCFTYRHYGFFESDENQKFEPGIYFFTNDGKLLRNFPKQHSDALTKKNKATDGAYTATVRMFKNIRDDLSDRRALYPGVAKSYFIENLLYVLPDSSFIGTRLKVFEQIMSDLIELYKIDFIRNIKCANGIDHLFGQDNWQYHDALIFLGALKRVQNGRQF